MRCEFGARTSRLWGDPLSLPVGRAVYWILTLIRFIFVDAYPWLLGALMNTVMDEQTLSRLVVLAVATFSSRRVT